MLAILIVALICMPCTIRADAHEDSVIVAFETKQYSVLAGKSITVKPVIQNYKGKLTYTFESSDTAIATVKANGTAKGIKAGKAIITCIVGTKEKQYNVSYTLEVLQPVQKIIIEENNLNMHTWEDCPLTIRILPEDAAIKELTWNSSNPNVASVYNAGDILEHSAYEKMIYTDNTVVAEYVGSTTLTATAKDGSGVKASIKVTVPAVSFSRSNIVFDKPGYAELTYWINEQKNGNMSHKTKTSGGCFGALRDDRPPEKHSADRNSIHLNVTPGSKEGKGKFTVIFRGRQYSVNVEVRRSAVYKNEKYESYGKDNSIINQGCSVNGTIIDCTVTENYDYECIIKVDNKSNQFATVVIPERLLRVRGYHQLLTGQTLFLEEHPDYQPHMFERTITVRGIFTKMIDYIAASGLHYSIPYFTADEISLYN